MAKFIIDSSAWIEYLGGSQKGEKLKPYFEKGELFTTAICVSEVVAKALREGSSAEIALDAMRSMSSIIKIDFSLGADTGKLYFDLRKTRSKIALSDVLSVVAARNISGRVLTFDNDFDKLPEATVLN